MADSASATGIDAPEGETPNQRQARLRREKLKKKMAEQGEDRLAKIRGLNGGVAPPDEVLGGPTARNATVHDDPAEVDISTFNTPTLRSQTPAQGDDFANMLRQMQQQQGPQSGMSQDDPMMQMMQQMMGSLGGQQPGGGDMPPIPPALQAMLGGGAQGDGKQAAQEVAKNTSSYMWKIIHAVFAFTLATYIALTSTFNGTKLARHQVVYTDDAGYGLGPRLFIIFTSVELLLQSTRYFMERGQLQGGGMLATVANSGFVPEPYAHYIRVLGRYITIAQTIFSDVMVIVFVFGVLAWWQGLTLTTDDSIKLE